MLTATSSARDSWLITLRPGKHTRMRLFCFPYAGGGPSVYRAWANQIPAEIEICSVQMPGKERRLGEAPLRRLSVLVDRLAETFARGADLPFSFFGYSLGSLVAFELTRSLRAQNCIGPAHLFVAAHRAPHLPSTHKRIHHLPQAEFVEELTKFNGTPESVLRNPELMEILLPGIQADFEMYETYAYRPDSPLTCPITAFGGDTDRSVPPQSLEAWRQQTSGPFRAQFFGGGHFFLNDALPSLVSELNRDLQVYVRYQPSGLPSFCASSQVFSGLK